MTLRTDSERWFVACWPAILTLLLGWFLFLGGAAKERRDLSRRIDNQGPLDNQRALLDGARAELALVNQEKDRLAAEIEKSRVSFDRSTSMRKVSLLCDELKLQIGEVKPETSANLVPAALKKATAGIPSQDGSASQLWCIELTGTYPAVTKLLKSLASNPPMTIPVNLTMKCDARERKPPVWNLYLLL